LIKPIQAVDLRQNESDGAILVELNGTIHADVIEADMNAITGEAPNGKTLYDLYNRLIAAPATEAKQDSILAAIQNVSSSANTPKTGVVVGSSTTLALAANTARKSAVFTNDSNETIYLALGSEAAMNQGIRLNANGGSYEINQTNLYTGIVTAICASGSKNLCVSEV